MNYYQNTDGEVFAYENEEQRMQFGSADLRKMSASDLDAFLESKKPKPTYPVFIGNDKLELFTKSEQLAIVTATLTDPVVKLMYDRLLGAAFLTYEDPETEYGLSLLVSKGLLTSDRKDEIVALMQAS